MCIPLAGSAPARAPRSGCRGAGRSRRTPSSSAWPGGTAPVSTASLGRVSVVSTAPLSKRHHSVIRQSGIHRASIGLHVVSGYGVTQAFIRQSGIRQASIGSSGVHRAVLGQRVRRHTLRRHSGILPPVRHSSDGHRAILYQEVRRQPSVGHQPLATPSLAHYSRLRPLSLDQEESLTSPA